MEPAVPAGQDQLREHVSSHPITHGRRSLVYEKFGWMVVALMCTRPNRYAHVSPPTLHHARHPLSLKNGRTTPPYIPTPTPNQPKPIPPFPPSLCRDLPAWGAYRGATYNSHGLMRNLVCCDAAFRCSPYQPNNVPGGCPYDQACPTLGSADPASPFHGQRGIDDKGYPQFDEEIRKSSSVRAVCVTGWGVHNQTNKPLKATDGPID